jgi:hypothetical protein
VHSPLVLCAVVNHAEPPQSLVCEQLRVSQHRHLALHDIVAERISLCFCGSRVARASTVSVSRKEVRWMVSLVRAPTGVFRGTSAAPWARLNCTHMLDACGQVCSTVGAAKRTGAF